MQTFFSGLYRLSLQFIRILSLAFTGLLFVSSFLGTCYAQDMTTQEVLSKWDNPLTALPGTALFLLLLLLTASWVYRNPLKRLPGLLCLVIGWCALWGVLLVLFGKTVPAADAMSVYSVAESLAEGDTSVIHPTDSYLSYYPQQVGLAVFYEPLIRLWNLVPTVFPAYHFIKCIYVVLVCVIILCQYRTVHLLWEDCRADCLYLLLAGTNLPLILYSSFVYGEIPSFAAFSAGLLLLLGLLRGKISRTVPGGVCCLFLFTLSVMLRKNTLILILAVLITVILTALAKRRQRLLLLALGCAVCCFFALPLTRFWLEQRSGSSLSAGVPPMSYFAMGMQESSRGNGWYNAFNFDTYQACDMDTERTNEASQAAIRERLSYFKANPGYAASFYLHKYLSQWTDGTYASRQATLATFGGRREFFNRIYEGEYSPYFISFCNVYQNILYLGAFLFALGAFFPGPSEKTSASDRRPGFPLYVYLGMIGVFGGFLFHMIWEANSRYILPYGLLLMPYAAYGLARAAERGKSLKNRH